MRDNDGRRGCCDRVHACLMARMCTIDDEVESVQTFDEFDPEMAQTCVRALTGAIPIRFFLL